MLEKLKNQKKKPTKLNTMPDAQDKWDKIFDI